MLLQSVVAVTYESVHILGTHRCFDCDTASRPHLGKKTYIYIQKRPVNLQKSLAKRPVYIYKRELIICKRDLYVYKKRPEYYGDSGAAA